MKMQNTAILMREMNNAVPHFNLQIVFRLSAMMAILLMMICIKKWISTTQRRRVKKDTGTLLSKMLDCVNSLGVTAVAGSDLRGL